ncbi:formate dehydrogenase subunit gamma [Litchfieldella qijiaojingensis]|uniref:Formate dehydrogenase subunit gamma n=1 Tax=Litchfieldella qijiaojingensis TaxID=980347 RepID=A0ABQ2YCD9_9GAMM|nr:formate dehydrogenase subunit gamma [Halomonas qijiaojingensis]GGX78694.1 formate dehydrogenase subunit gamma [Halomonas qijiaojingensis]
MNLLTEWLHTWRVPLLALLVLLSLGMAGPVLAQADPEGEIATAVPATDADTWRQVRSGETGPNYRDSRFDSNYNLINASGETWRQIRNRWVSPFGLIAICGMLAMIVLFYLIVGRKHLDEPRTGRKLLRWTALERSLHWSVATLFIILALTGLNLLYGKFLFKTLFGDAFWAGMISGSKMLHNYLGPLFGVLLVIILAKFLVRNLPSKHDWTWFKQGGGLIGKGRHPDAGFANGGEKVWYWLLATAGLVVIASGLVLDFPNYGQSRDAMQWANIVHAVGALGLTAVALGHIYIGTLGTEGSLEGMATGYVDETWAKEHHNLWYEEVKHQAADADETLGEESTPPQRSS